MKRAFLILPWVAVVAAAIPVAPGDPEPEVFFAPTGGQRLIEKRITQEIRGAQKRLWVAIYQFTSKDIADALVSAKKRGVDVRVLVDGVQTDNAAGTPYGEAIAMLASGGVPVRKVHPIGLKNHSAKKDAGINEALRPKFHHKFCVVDDVRVITGSYNWTVLADEENHENMVVLTGKGVNARFAEQWEKIWKDETITEGAKGSDVQTGKSKDAPAKTDAHVTTDGPYVPPGTDPDKP